jgi:hypothetical protein
MPSFEPAPRPYERAREYPEATLLVECNAETAQGSARVQGEIRKGHSTDTTRYSFREIGAKAGFIQYGLWRLLTHRQPSFVKP